MSTIIHYRITRNVACVCLMLHGTDGGGGGGGVGDGGGGRDGGGGCGGGVLVCAKALNSKCKALTSYEMTEVVLSSVDYRYCIKQSKSCKTS